MHQWTALLCMLCVLCCAGSTTSMPPMKMWYHQSTRDIFLFKEWVPSSSEWCTAMCGVV
jgi:hypothetical protein